MGEPEAWLEPDETEVAAWAAAIPTRGGRGAKYGGRLHLTPRRLVWVPLTVPVITAQDFLIAGSVGGDAWAIALSDIARVEGDRERRALLHIVSRAGEQVSFLIAAGRLTPLWSKKNQVARDEAVARISAALEG